MNKDKDYASDSDSSDEDFCPDEETGKPESEESSDDEISDDNVNDVQGTLKTKKRKGKGKVTKTKADTAIQNENESKRSTRHSTEAGKTDTRDTAKEKEEIESDDDDKARADALWADFLGDVKQTPVEVNKTESSSKTSKIATNGDTPRVDHSKKANGLDETPKGVTITEVLDLAGEEVRVQKTVSADSVKENQATTSKNPVGGTSGLVAGLKRKNPAPASSSSSGGLGSLLNQIGKKKKISVLEKTKMDWNTFKKDEGIEEQLQTFNKGKDGFLERQDFLERTDLRQFEIERNLRQTRRNH